MSKAATTDIVTLFCRHWYPSVERGIALLLHGMSGNSLHWGRIATHLQDLGYHVIAPDLSGHGLSPRKNRYSIAAWVEEVTAAIAQEHVDVIMGHSLGGIIAAGVATRLPYQPRQIIMVDPAWYFPYAPLGWIVQGSLVSMRLYTPQLLRKQNPNWTEEDVTLELDSIKAWDMKSVRGLTRRDAQHVLKDFLQTHHGVTTIVKQANSVLVTRARRVQLQKLGIRFVNLPNLSHNLHRDDTPLFLRAIRQLLHIPEDHLASVGVETESAVELT